MTFSVQETISKIFKAGHEADGNWLPDQHEHMWGSFDVTDGVVFADRPAKNPDDVILGRIQREQQEASGSPWLRKPLQGSFAFAVAEQMRLESSVSPAEPSSFPGMGVFCQETLGH